MASLWRDGTFRRIWGGQTASIFGDRVTDIALPWLILAQTHSPFDAGLVAAARYGPMVLLGLPAGVLADRMPRRPPPLPIARAVAASVARCGLPPSRAASPGARCFMRKGRAVAVTPRRG